MAVFGDVFDECLRNTLARSQEVGIDDAIAELLERSEAGTDCLSPDCIGQLYEQVLAGSADVRKKRGSFYTPTKLTDILVEHAIAPVLEDHLKRQPSNKADAILSLRILDPACGAGAFLLAAGEFLANQLHQITNTTIAEARIAVARYCLFGVDIDGTALRIARWSLGRWSMTKNAGSFRQANALFDLPDSETAKYDVVIGNPPFANAIEGTVDKETKRKLSDEFPLLGGTADLSYYFLELSHRLARADGSVGLVLPRAVLAAPAAKVLRESLNQLRPPKLLLAPSSQYLFAGANVYVTLVVLSQLGCCRGGRSLFDLEPVVVEHGNWWAPLCDRVPMASTPETLGDHFEVSASMTTGQAYLLRDFIVEAKKAGGADRVRFVTTGLIDPGVCHWGSQVCRYLGMRFHAPEIATQRMPPDLKRRVERARRPKILVAGLSTRIEAYFDAVGQCAGAVSTITITHPSDDRTELARLCDYLNSEVPSKILVAELGALALGGGRITIGKRFIKSLPLSASNSQEPEKFATKACR